MRDFKSQSKNLDTLKKELCLIHQQIDNMSFNDVKVYQLNKPKVSLNIPESSLNIKERFRVAVNEFRHKIDMKRKTMHSNIA